MIIKSIIVVFLFFGLLQSQIFQWDEPVRISNNSEGWCTTPSICNDSNGNLYVTFGHFNHDENNHLYFTWYDGQYWQGVDTLYNEQYYDVYHTKVLCDNDNNLHLSVEIAYGAFGRVFYMKREGNDWSDLIQISIDSLGNNWGHDMVIDDSGKIYIFFHTQDIYYRTINDSIISEPINVTNIEEEQISAFEPSVAINSHNKIYLCYTLDDETQRIYQIYYREFNGAQWSDPENLSQIDVLSGYEPNITVDNRDNPHVVWRQKQDDYYCIFYSTRYKGQWSTPLNISNIPNSSSYFPKIKFYNGNPLVFYHTIYENNDRENNYSYFFDNKWSIHKFDVNINTSLRFDYLVSDLDTLHFVTRSSPPINKAYIEYVKGFNSPTSIQDSHIKNPESLKVIVYPNPFNNKIKIDIHLNKPDEVDIKIFDVTGKVVKTILSDQLTASGFHSITWDSKNNQGYAVSSGIYFLLLSIRNKTFYHTKLLLTK